MTPQENLIDLAKKSFPGYPEHDYYNIEEQEWLNIAKTAFNLGIETCAENAKIITVVDPYSGPQEYLDRETVNKLKI